MQLGDFHYTFRAGNRIQVDVTSSNFPRRARNTNSGNLILAHDTKADICMPPIRCTMTTRRHLSLSCWC
jgi:predicted acyl esterase